ncbi:DUF4347 domain-containing protein [Caballeronia sp. 15711]|uniref:DUF4347 domain-containing protein n=1 Tax=Caballeronia sp. 15711 TaxID=3391029 RepID=UPI0039E60DED
MKIIQQLLKRFGDARAPEMTPVDTRGRPAHRAVTAAPLLMLLEPRVIYDASVGAIAAHPHAHGADADTHASTAAATNATVHAAPKTIAEHDVHLAKPVSATAAPNPATPAKDSSSATQKTDTQKTAQSGDVATSDSASHAVVFVDPSVADYQSLIAGLPAGTRYVVLNANTDGFAQIAQYLQTHQGIQSIHLISHGTDGEIQAGAAWLNSSNLSNYSGDLAAIGAAMAPGGDFLIYGCDVAEHADGQALVQQVAALTHLNVAASTDLTGSTAVGGDWTLEYQVGDVHTPVLLSAATEQAYDHVLGDTIENYTGTDAASFSTGGDVTSFTLDGLIYTFKDVNGNPIAIDASVTTDSFLQALADEGGSGNALQINDVVNGLSSIVITRVGNTPFNFKSIDLDIVSDQGADGTVTVYADSDVGDGVTLNTGNNFTAATMTLTGNSFADAHSITISGKDLFADFGHLVYADVGPSLTVSSPSTTFTSADNTASTPVVVNSSIAFADTTATTAQSATITIANFKTGDELLYTPVSGISGVYSSSSGVLTLTGSATIAQWEAALESITFTNTQAAPNTATRTIDFSITDSAGATATATSSIAVVDVDQTPIVTTSNGPTAYTAGTAAKAIDAGVTVTDSDSTSQTSATVKIGGTVITGDTLNFTNTSSALYGNITEASYSGGVLTLTGTATDAQYQNALEAVTFSAGAGTTGGSRSITFQTSDGTNLSAAATKLVDVTVLPIVTTDTGSATFVAGNNTASSPVHVDPGVTVTDSEKGTMVSATVTITNVVSAEDSLSFTNDLSTMGNIAGSYNATTGVLSLSSAGGTATVAQWQSALRSITYTDSAITPNNTSRTITFVVNDGVSSSTPVNRTVTVQDTDQSPVVTLSSGSATYVAGAPAATIDNGVTVTDRDSTPLLTATIQITGGLQTGDTLTFVGDGFVTSNVPSGTTLTLTATGSISEAQWMIELDKIQFSSAANATAGTRTISYSVTDNGGAVSNTVTRNVNVVVAPLVTTDSTSAIFIAGDNAASTPLTIDSGLTVSDGSSTTLVSATVQITTNFNSGEDLLIFTPTGATGDITGSYDASSGVLTLTSASHATLAQWQSALSSIQYDDLAVTPSGTSRTIAFTVNDGANSSPTATRNVTVHDTDQTPILTLSGSSNAYTAGSAAITIDSGITITDLDNTSLMSATISISAGFHTGDTLALTSDGFVTSSYDAAHGILTLTATSGNVSVSQWMTELDNVKFSSASDAAAGARTISYVVNDGTTSSAPQSRTVTVTAVPIVTVDSGSTLFVAGDNSISTPVAVDSGLTVADGSSTTFVSATVSITGNPHSGEDVLIYTTSGATGDITGSYDVTTGVLTLTSASHASLAQWQAALRSVQYYDSAITPNSATRTISFTLNDGANSSPTVSRTVTVQDTDQSPILTTSGGTTAFVEADNATSTPVAVDTGVTVSDLDNGTFVSAHVAITGGFAAGQDVLAFNNSDFALYGDITATYDSGTGVLTLTSSGASTLAQWQAALRAVTYTDTAITPDATPRTISFTVNDGAKDSDTGTHAVSVAGTDQSPVLTSASGDATYLPGSAAHTVDGGITLTDTDSTTMASVTVQFTTGFQSGDQLSVNFNAATMSSNFNVTYDSAAGILTITRTGSMTLANWQAIVDNVQFSSAAGVPLGARTLSVVTSDGVKDSNTLSYEIDVISSAPQVSTTSTGDATFIAGDNAPGTPVALDGNISVSDPLGNTLLQATVSITTHLHSGEDVLQFTNDGLTMGDITGSYNALTGTLTLFSGSGTATDGQWDAALRAVMYTDTAVTPNTATRTVSFSITDGTQTSTALTRDITVGAVDQSPVVVTSSGDARYVEGDNVVTTVAVDSGIIVTDADNTTLASATVSITSGFHAGEDQLAFDSHGDTTTFGNIAESYDATTGVMTLNSLNGTATLAQWQAALRAITYSDTAVTPDTTQRAIIFTVNDGTRDSGAAGKLLNLTATDQSPVLSASGGNFNYLSGAAAHTIDGGITLTDSDSQTMASLTVQVTSGFHSGDQLSLDYNSATMGASFTTSFDAVAGTFTVTRTGSMTLANWQAIVDGVQFSSTAGAPLGTRSLSIATSDGTKDSNTLAYYVDVLNSAPQLSTTSAGSASFIAGDNVSSTPVAVDRGLSVLDPLGNPITMATVSITGNFHSGEDVLQYTRNGTTMGDISGSFNTLTGVLTLNSASGTASNAQWDAALRSVTFTDTAVTPDTATRSVSFSVTDGTQTSAALTRTVTVADVDQTPVVTTSSGAASYVEGDNAVMTIAVDSGITLTDRDNATLASATVSITSGFHAGEDVLAFSNTSAATFGNIAASYDASSGVMTLNSAGATATVAQWQAALHAITYADTASVPAGVARTVSFTVNDGTKDSVAGTRDIDLTATAQTPALTAGSGEAPTFNAIGAGATPVVIDSGISIGDRDANAHLESALVSISGNFQPGKDVLAFNSSAATGNITASYDPGTGVLTLSSAGASATLTQWQAALASVTYADTSAETSGASRTISFAVTIGGKSSAALTRSVNVAAEPVTPPPSSPPPSTPPATGLQPTPPTLVTLPPRSPFVGNRTSPVTITPAPAASAPDTIAAFPMDLDGSISSPLIVLDLFADAPEIGAIPTVHTATFSTGDFGELGASNGSGKGSGTHWHGSISDTSVASMQPIPVPDSTLLPIDLPSQAFEVDVAANQAFTLSLPIMLGADGVPAGADTHIEMLLADGRALPRWLHFDAVRGALSGKVPAHQGPLQISIIARDAAGHQVNREVTIDFNAQRGHAARGLAHTPGRTPAFNVPHAGLPIAKPSLAEQLNRAHATLHVARPTGASRATSVAGLVPAPAIVTVDRDNA